MIKNLIISTKVQQHIKEKHNVVPLEVHEAFANIQGPYLLDTREDHVTDPTTEWFVAPTDRGRLLKVCFVPRGGKMFLKSAFDPNDEELRIYKSLSS